MHRIHRLSKRTSPSGHRPTHCFIFLAMALVTVLSTTNAAAAGDLLAPNLAPPVTQAENDIAIDPLYYDSLCDTARSVASGSRRARLAPPCPFSTSNH